FRDLAELLSRGMERLDLFNLLWCYFRSTRLVSLSGGAGANSRTSIDPVRRASPSSRICKSASATLRVLSQKFKLRHYRRAGRFETCRDFDYNAHRMPNGRLGGTDEM